LRRCSAKEWIMNKRLEAVVSDIVEGVRGALTKHDVTLDGYR
jgi:chlorocatechol 1,2-dioxygenase